VRIDFGRARWMSIVGPPPGRMVDSRIAASGRSMLRRKIVLRATTLSKSAAGLILPWRPLAAGRQSPSIAACMPECPGPSPLARVARTNRSDEVAGTDRAAVKNALDCQT